MGNENEAFLQFHQDALSRGEILIQQCKDCGQHVFYPRALCNFCDSEDLKWVKAVGRGCVHSLAGNGTTKVVIELEEGPRMEGYIFDLEPDEVVVGMKLSAHIVLRDGELVVAFSCKGREDVEW